jgi:hypothetical protein
MGWRSADSAGAPTVVVNPRGDLVGVEPDEVAPLDVGDAPLGDESTNAAGVDAKVRRKSGDVEQSWQFDGTVRLLGRGVGHGGTSSWVGLTD